jgi:arabinogalactan oligomer/maltooligosaccharide transport system permease protein
MNTAADLEYLSLSKSGRYVYKLKNFFKNIPHYLWVFLKWIPTSIWNLFKKIGNAFKSLVDYFYYGDWKTKISFIIFGFGSFANKQYLRGIIYFVYEIAFIAYMVLFGGQYISKFNTLGTVETHTADSGFKIVGDNSFAIMLYSVATFIIILFTVFIWVTNIKNSYENQQSKSIAKRLATAEDDGRQSMNNSFHITLLSIPLLTLVIFTVVPLFFMIFVAFTNYDGLHMPPNKLFTWVGWDNFSTLLSGNGLAGNSANWNYTFLQVLWWTLLWAVLATFTNFIIGLLVAMLINKKGIRLKKVWRTCLVVVMAVPQFISLLLMSKMLTNDGAFNIVLKAMGLGTVNWLYSPWTARLTIILVNIWIGVPYTVLSSTGILMNIPSDLYEAAKIDGANKWQMFSKITMPYIMFVMGPSLITTFVGNINNFNIIYLLTGGTTGVPDTRMSSCYAGQTDLLITWLYKLTVNNQYYGIASVIGIFVFIICAFFSLVVYNNIGSVKNEEEFQ